MKRACYHEDFTLNNILIRKEITLLMSREKFLCKDENEIENIIQGWFSHRLFWSSMNLFFCHICVKWPKQIRIRSNYNKENGTHIQFMLYFDLIKQYSNKAWTLQTYTALCKNAILTNFILKYQIDTKEGSRHGNDSHVDRGSYNR